MQNEPYAGLTQLGKPAEIPESPQQAVLDTFSNPHPDRDYIVRLTAPEFTSICPITGQPDFATLIIDYVPDQLLVESKSFKLFLMSYRNHGAFHEDCTVAIQKRLQQAMAPQYIRVIGLWYARGGITIDVLVESGNLPDGCQPLPVGKSTYRGGRS